MARTDPRYFDQFLAEFADGPGRAYTFLVSHNRWWHLDDGYWSWTDAGYLLNQAIPKFANIFLAEHGLLDQDARADCYGTLTRAKNALKAYLSDDALPGRPRDPFTSQMPPATSPQGLSSEPPAQPGPSEPAQPPEPGPPDSLGTGEPAA